MKTPETTRRTTLGPGPRALLPALALLLILLLVGAAPGRAQETMAGGAAAGARPANGGEGAYLEVVPYIGVLAPISDLTPNNGVFVSQLSSSVLLGGQVGYWLANGFGIAGRFGYAPASISVAQASPDVTPPTIGDVHYLTFMGELLYRFELQGTASAVEPFVGLSGGVRRLSFQGSQTALADATDPAGGVVAGSYVGVGGPLALRFEVSYTLSSYDGGSTGQSKTQQDLGVTFGAALRTR